MYILIILESNLAYRLYIKLLFIITETVKVLNAMCNMHYANLCQLIQLFILPPAQMSNIKTNK